MKLYVAILCMIVFSAVGNELQFDFGQIYRFRTYPAQYFSNLEKLQENDETVLRFERKAAAGDSIAAYTWLHVPEHSTVLELEMAVYLKGSKATCYLTYRKGDKQIGKEKFELPQNETYHTVRRTFTLPENCSTIQLAVNLDGSPGEIRLKALKPFFSGDAIGITPRPAGFNAELSPDEWKDVSILRGLYESSSGEPAELSTVVKITYDEQNLYLGYICDEPNMNELTANIKKHDGGVWQDDCVELFIYNPSHNRGWQFIVNTEGVREEAELRQNQAGDPYWSDQKWNCEWRARIFKKSDNYQAVMTIPWKSLGYDGLPEKRFKINLARERKIVAANTQWNAYVGKFNEVEKYADVELSAEQGRIVRYRNLEKLSFVPKRAKQEFETLLGDNPGYYKVQVWRNGIADFSGPIRRKYSPEVFLEWQDYICAELGKLGLTGPFLPWAIQSVGHEKLLEYHRKYGLKYPYFLHSSATSTEAKKSGTKLYSGLWVDRSSQVYLDASLRNIEDIKNNEFIRKNPEIVAYFYGIDEPANPTRNIFSRINNPEAAAELDAYEKNVMEQTGFGKYGLPDELASVMSADIAFRRIAFWRYWHRGIKRHIEGERNALHEILPDVPHLGVNRNSVNGMCPVDVAELTEASQWIGCDPYPTSSAVSYGMARALYHTGFSVKLLADLAPESKHLAILQGFIYHGHRPEPDDMREWAAQALKNGADIIDWYVEGPSVLLMPEGYDEILSLNRQISKLPALKLPDTTATAILISDFDRWAIRDSAVHAAYTVYSILGEHNGQWFKFISPTSLKKGYHNLADYKILYVPRLSYTDPELTANLMKFVENGGILVSFDPDFLKYNIDGSTPPERPQLFAGEITLRKQAGSVTYKQKNLPLTAIRNLNVPETGRIAAYDFAHMPPGSAVLAVYDDGKPAIVEISRGKGSIVLSAAMPFGNSEAVLNPQGWKSFFADFAARVGEKEKLPVWNFQLPRLPEHQVKLNYKIR